MSEHANESVFEEATAEFLVLAREKGEDLMEWVNRLSDVERLIGLGLFIGVLFMLVLVQSARRKRDPGKARSFVGSFVLVVTFSFLVGLLIDSEFDPRHFLTMI